MAYLEAAGRRFKAGAVIFDKDCTLIDTLRSWPRLVEFRNRILVERHGVTPELVTIICRAIGYDQNARRLVSPSPLVTGPRVHTQAAMATVLFLNGWRWDEAFAAVIDSYQHSDHDIPLADLSIPYPGAVDLLRDLFEAKVPVAVATNDIGERTRGILGCAGMAGFVQVVVGGDEVPTVKPAPDLALAACERLGVAPGAAVVIGDSVLDIQMGEAAGAEVTIGVMTGLSSQEELSAAADLVVDSVADLRVVSD